MGVGEDMAGGGSPGVKPGALTDLLRRIAGAPVEEQGGAWGAVLCPGATVGRFELVRELGRGGFGVVWEAKDRALGRSVAFKAVRFGGEAGLREERLLKEAETAARLTHPNIVTLYDLGRVEQGPYLVLELLRGQTLAERLSRGAPPVEEALRVGVEVAKGVAHAHGQGVIHRDLKPDNVFLCEDGQVKVLDFGLAHAFGQRKLEGGTRGYMAPEQLRGAPEDERTDVFALGVILHELLSGRPAFTGEDPPGKDRASPPRLEVAEAPSLGPLVARMLATDPVRRPRDGGEVLQALAAVEKALAGAGATRHGVRRTEASPAEALDRAPRGRRLAVLLGALGLVAAAPGVAWYVWKLRPQPTAPAPAEAQAPAPSVAVLQFADMSAEHDQEYFADGVAEEIRNALAQVDGLHVAGRSSSFSFKGKQVALAEIGRRLGVTTALEGSIRKSGKRVRVTAQLVKTADGFQIWSQTFDRDLSDIFAVQDEVARAVVEAMKLKALPRHLSSRRWTSTADPEVYNQYLLGREFHRVGTLDGYRRAVRAFERALALDPGYAPAWAGITAAILDGEGLSDEGDPEQARRAAAAAERAIALAPDLAEGYFSRAQVREWVAFDLTGALADVEHALALNPDFAAAECSRASLLSYLGRKPEALAAARRATELEPLQALPWYVLAGVLDADSELEPARAAYARVLEIAPEDERAMVYLAINRIRAGQPGEALATAPLMRTGAWRLLVQTLAMHGLGDAHASRVALDRLTGTYAGSWAYQIAEAHAYLGGIDEAFAWLDRALAQRDYGMALVKRDPLLRSLHADPRWKPFLRKLKLPED